MIRFVDLDNGVVFNGSRPYIFWMDHEQSTQLIYVKKICVLTDAMSLKVSIPVNDVFQLINMQELDTVADIEVNDFSYKNLRQLYTNSYISGGTNIPNINGEPVTQTLFLHMIYIAAQSENIGEFHELFKLEDEQFEIAADFYTERENLKINLSNFGVELPESIQSAIYDTNVHEEAKDNITLNRKYKELLLQYWDIVANRGSYKSLIKSLDWFEYGDLIKINEIWKHREWGMDKLNREELNMIMTNKIKSTLANFTKTTYIGLYAALQKYLTVYGEVQYEKLSDLQSVTSGGDIDFRSATLNRYLDNNPLGKDWLFTIGNDDVTIAEYVDDYDEIIVDRRYFDPDSSDSSDDVAAYGSNWERPEIEGYQGLLGENVPKLVNQDMFKWSIEDLSLKMYLLGCFYEAYFMPIHMDILHSTIEELVFANTIKCMNINYLDRVDSLSNTETFACNVKEDSTYRLQDVHVQANYATPMSREYRPFEYSDSDDVVFAFGVENEVGRIVEANDADYDDSREEVQNQIKTFYMNNFNGIGVVIPFECTIPAEEGDFINYEKVIISSDANIKDFEKHTLYASQETEEGIYKYLVNFNLLLTDEGRNTITLFFSTAGGRSYVKSIHVNVLGDTSCKLGVYVLESCSNLSLDPKQYNLNVIPGYSDDFKQKYIRPYNKYMFTHTRYNGWLRDDYGYFQELPGNYRMFIPGVNASTALDKGVKYNRVIIFDGEVPAEKIEGIRSYFREFNIAVRHVQGTDKTYYTLISKKFVNDFNESDVAIMNAVHNAVFGYIVRESDGFFPDHHYLRKLGVVENGIATLDDYTITDKDTLVVVPEMMYSHVTLEDIEWIFKNVSTIDQEEVQSISIKEPFVGNSIKDHLKSGFYNITFNYKVDGKMLSTTLNSAFRKV